MIIAIAIVFGHVVPATALGASKTVVPKLNEESRRGDMARKQMENTSQKFLIADSDRDLKISLSEAEEHFPFIARNFERYDKNSDGKLTWYEYLGHKRWPVPKHEKET